MLKCPKCGCDASFVIDSRSVDGGVRRRRQCIDCSCRYTTYESAKETAKRTIIRELGPILMRNISEAIKNSFREIKE